MTQGHGTLFEENGDTYEGDWLGGRRHGRGRAVYGGRPIDGFGGDVYEGHWENDMKWVACLFFACLTRLPCKQQLHALGPACACIFLPSLNCQVLARGRHSNMRHCVS